MAKRTRRPKPSEDCRAKIQTTQLINRVQNHAFTYPSDPDFVKKFLTDSQVRAALGLLKKTLPDLQNIELGNKPGEKLSISWES
jgi:hypothetical protein